MATTTGDRPLSAEEYRRELAGDAPVAPSEGALSAEGYAAELAEDRPEAQASGEALSAEQYGLQLRGDALERDFREYNLMRQQYTQARRFALQAEDPTSKHRAAAMAGYLRDKMVGAKPSEEDLEEFLATARMPGEMPGKKEGLLAAADLADFITSPISRPLYSILSASADTGYLADMPTDERVEWLNRMHPDDPRRDIYWELHELTERAKEDPKASTELKKFGWSTLLALRYWLPGVDPYGGGPARPWQEIERGGVITGGGSATTMDVIARSLVRGDLGGGAADALRSRVHGVAEYAEVLPEFLAAAFTDEDMGDAWSRSREEAHKVWSGAPDADPYEGSFLPSLLFTVAPDLGVSLTTKAARSVTTAAGLLTKSGDSAVSATIARTADRVADAARAADQAISTESIEALVDASRNAAETAYSAVGDAAARGMKVGVGAPVRSADDLAAEVLAKPTAARLGVVHVDLDDAITLKVGDDGAGFVDIDMSRARVLYNDDPLVKAATRDSVMRGLDDSERALLKRALDDMGADDLSSSEIFFNLKNRGYGKKIALAGGLGFGAGFLSPAEDASFLDRLESGFKGGLAGLAGGAVLYGGGRGFGTIVDSTGRAAVKLGFPTGSLRLERLEKMRAGLFGFKELKPWATKRADGTWRPIEAADMVGDHMWARHKFLLRRKRFTEAKLRAETQQAIYNTMSGVYRKKDREIVASLAEALGAGGRHEDVAHRLLAGLRRHLNKSLRFLPKEKTGYFDVSFKKGANLGKRFDTREEMWEAFDAAVKADDIDALESFIRAKSSPFQRTGDRFLRDLNKRAAAVLASVPDSVAGRYLKARTDYLLGTRAARKGGGMAGRARTRAAAGRKELEALAEARKAAAKKGRARKGKGKTKLLKEREEAAEQVRSLLREDPYAPGGRSVADVVRRYAEKATMVSQILRQITGVADAAELKALRGLEKKLMSTAKRAAGELTDEEFVKVLENLSPLDARRASAAFRKRGGKLDPRYADLSDDAKLAVDGVRSFFESMYRLLKAEGALPKDWSLEFFLDSLEVGGYVSHMLTRGGARAIGAMKSQFGGRFASIDTALDIVRKRKLTGTIEEINEETRQGIAEMIWRQLPENADKADDFKIPKEDLSEIISSQGLDRVKFFETDAAKIMMEYGGKTSRWVSNTRYVRNLRSMFPDGDRFASLARGEGGRASADLMAQAAGYRRVDGVAHLRAVAGETAWPGFDKHKEAIGRILTGADPDTRGAQLYEFLKKNGADIDDAQTKLQIETLAEDLYLPDIYADMVETLAVPSRMEKWASGDSVLADAIGLWDDVTNFFKVQTTILAPAFHGRNFISNVVTNTMVHGFSAVKPSNQIDSVFLMRAPDDATWTLVQTTPGGQKLKTTMTVRQWREELRAQGMIVDDFDISDSIRKGGKPSHLRTGLLTGADPVDIGRSKGLTALFGAGGYSRILRPSTYRVPAYTGALGASIGGVAGYGSGGTPEERLRKAFAGVLVGGMAGMGSGAMFDLFLRDPTMAAKQTYGELAKGTVREGFLLKNPAFFQNMKPALSAGFDEWMDLVGGADRSGFKDTFLHLLGGTESGRVALVGGAVGAAGGAAMTTQGENKVWGALKGAAAGMLATGGLKAWGEGAFVVSGGIGRKIEEQAKIASYLAGRKSGLSADGAADIVHKTLFDYGDLSKFERHWLRRVFPFYTWSSKNATTLQPWLLQNRPLSYSFLTKFIDAADGGFSSTEDYAWLPEHMRYRAVVNAGLGKIFAGFGLPQEDLTELLKTRDGVPSGVIGRLHPAMLLLYKFTAGKDPYYNVDLDRVRSGRDVRYLPPFIQQYVGFAEVQKSRVVDGVRQSYVSYEVGHFAGDGDAPVRQNKGLGARRLALLRALPAWRLVSEYNKVMTDTFMPGVRSESGAGASGGERFLALTTGVKPYAVNWDSLEDYAYRDFERLLMAELQQQGMAGELPILFREPRNKMDELEVLRSLGLYEDEGGGRRAAP